MNATAFPKPSGAAAIEIALVNNMPDQAFEATKAQFTGLVTAAMRDLPFRMRYYVLPGVPRSETARQALVQTHDDIDTLYTLGADALIVTGAEPRAEMLEQEPYWGDFTRLVDWARQNTLGSLWSCLAAHGAVQRLDGVRRQRESKKISGIFRCNLEKDDWATQGGETWILVPHSRYNGLSRDDLERKGYRVSSWSSAIGLDSFWRREPSLFLFTQGHPEYDADTLSREFRRDALRFLDGQSEVFPAPPENCFSTATQKRLADWRVNVNTKECRRFAEELGKILAEERATNAWRNYSERLYRNWLTTIASEKNDKT